MLDVTAPSVIPRSRARGRVVKTSRGLSAIKRPGLDLCVWRRDVNEDLAAWCVALARSTEFVVDERGVRADDLEFSRFLREVPAGPMKDLWLADLHQVAAAYGRLVGDVPLRVQLSTIESRKCPRFHVDSVAVRLLCTYAGPGTEWIDEAHLDREHLRQCDADHAPLRPGGAVQQLASFEVALMKGSAFSGNGRFGLVHRSPAVTGARRLVLTLDTQHTRFR